MGIPIYKYKFLSWCQEHEYSLNELKLPHSLSGDIHCYHITKPSRSRNKILVFIHGGGNNALYPLIHFFPDALEAGYDIFSFDLDGHGPTSTTFFNSKSIQQNISYVLHHLSTTYDYKQYFCIAHSLGGALLIPHLRQKHVFDAVALWSTPVKIDLSFQTLKNELFGLIDMNIFRALRVHGLLDMIPSMGPFRRPALPFRPDATTDTYIKRSFIGHIQDSLDLIFEKDNEHKIDTPAFLVYGAKDLIANKAALDKVKSCFSNPQVIVFSKSTHANLLFQPSLLSQTIDFWEQAPTRDTD